MIGSRLDHWIIESELGRGGMGQVYLARQAEDGPAPGPRRAAVKILSPELAKETGFLERFKREIEILKQLHHPHIVQFYDSGCQDGRYFYAMEYVPGKNFEQLLSEHGRLPWKEVLDLGLQICPALKHAHDHGVIHRDIKPQNILRTEDGTVKLTDFGIARVFSGKHLTATGGLVGTAEYLSPEQAAGKPVTNRSDLYSFGVVLYLLLTGRPPFEGQSILDLMHKHRYAQFDPPRKLVHGLPAELDKIVCELLEKDPARRPHDGLVLQRKFEILQRKIDRRGQPTYLGVPRAETQADTVPTVPLDSLEEEKEASAGPATFISRWIRQELDRQQRGGPLSRFVNHPLVLVIGFAACVSIIAWSFWPRPASQVEPALRQQGIHVVSEAERFFRKGQSLERARDMVGARDVWQNLVLAFRGVDSEKAWVERAQEELAKLDVPPSDEQRWAPVLEALTHARELRDKGKRQDAEEIWRSFEDLYWNDPAARDILKQIKHDRDVK